MKIAFVEDHELVRSTFERVFERSGIAFDSYETAEDLLDGESWREADGLLTDQRLPGLSGLELVQKIREEGSDLPVLLLSGNLTGGEQQSLAAIGNAKFLPKPCSPGNLLAAIKAAFRPRTAG